MPVSVFSSSSSSSITTLSLSGLKVIPIYLLTV
jgi:hypothetical protein